MFSLGKHYVISFGAFVARSILTELGMEKVLLVLFVSFYNVKSLFAWLILLLFHSCLNFQKSELVTMR